jgi:hypothetical protein
METQCGRKPHNVFLYVKNYIQGSTNFQFSGSNQKEAPTPCVLWLQPEGGYNHPILWLQPEGGSNPLILRLQPEGSSNSLVLRLQLEGGSNHLVLRLQPEGSSNSLILRHQPEGGYNPLSLPHPATLKYKCQINDETTTTLSL